MKIGIVTDDKRTISPHFGRAQYYLVYEIKDGVVVNKEARPKFFHNQGVVGRNMANREEEHSPAEEASIHGSMLSNVADCEALITRGMGSGMYYAMKQAGIEPFVTSVAIADDAVQAYIKGTLDNHMERLH